MAIVPIEDQGVMLCEPSKRFAATPEQALDIFFVGQAGKWVADIKFDGIRCIAQIFDGKCRLVNRKERDVTFRYPEVVAAFEAAYPRGGWVFDGELICTGPDGMPDFSGAHLRDAQENVRSVGPLLAAHPVTFMAFDVIWYDGDDFRSHSYVVRRGLLMTEASQRWKTDTLKWSTSTADGKTLWDFVVSNGMEGIVAKHLDAPYRAGRSQHWVKLKKLYSISVIAVGKTKGTGHRAGTFGSIEMALINGDKPVHIGEVGTGFNNAEIADINARMDAGELLVMEVQIANMTQPTTETVKGVTREFPFGKARFPSWQHIRTDADVTDCTVAQLEGVPIL